MLETEALAERRSELMSQAETRKLSVAEVEELKTVLIKEAQHDFATSKIGFLTFFLLGLLIKNLPWELVINRG